MTVEDHLIILYVLLGIAFVTLTWHAVLIGRR